MQDVRLPLGNIQHSAASKFPALALPEDHLYIEGGVFGTQVELTGRIRSAETFDHFALRSEQQSLFVLSDGHKHFTVSQPQPYLLQDQYHFKHLLSF